MNWKRLMLMLAVSTALILPAEPQQKPEAPAGHSTTLQVGKKKAKHKKKRRKGHGKKAKNRKPQTRKIQ